MSSDSAPTLAEIKSFVNEHFRASDPLFQPRFADPILGKASLEPPQLLSEQEQHEVLSNLLFAHADHIRLLPTGRVLTTLTGTELLVQLVSCREHFAALKFRRAYWRAKNEADPEAAAAHAKAKEEAKQAAKETARAKRAAEAAESGEDAPAQKPKKAKASKPAEDEEDEDIASIAKKSKIVRTLEAEKAAEAERKARREARLAAAETKKDLMAEDNGSSSSDDDDAPAPASSRARAAPDVNDDDASYLASLRRTPAASNTLESVNEKRREKREKERKSRRFILFVGNLPYSYDETRIRELFDGTEIVGVRVPKHRDTMQPQGYAFVEFAGSRDVHYALSKHHEYVGERRINVELTAGGGGNSKARRSKISAKAQQLALERVENAERAAKAEATQGPSWHGAR